MKYPLSALARSAFCRRNIIAGLAGLMLGSMSGFVLILWSNRHSPVIVYEEPKTAEHCSLLPSCSALRSLKAQTFPSLAATARLAPAQ